MTSSIYGDNFSNLFENEGSYVSSGIAGSSFESALILTRTSSFPFLDENMNIDELMASFEAESSQPEV